MSNKQNKPPLFLLYIAMLTVLMIILLSFTLSNCSNSAQPKPSHKATQSTEQTEDTFTYIITSITSEGLHGQSTTDNTGIFLTHETVSDIELSLGSKVAVSFPSDDWEHVTRVVKIN